MEVEIWRDVFDNQIKETVVPHHKWSISADDNLRSEPGWLQYTQRTFARFRCSQCRRWWNSAEVHVLFLMKLDRTLRRGYVKMRIFRQECKKCNIAILEKPEISQENIMRIISNLIRRINNKFYFQSNENEDQKPEVYSDNMDGPHDKQHCEACKQNVCLRQIKMEQRKQTFNPTPAKTVTMPSMERLRVREPHSVLTSSTSNSPVSCRSPAIQSPPAENQNTLLRLVGAVALGLASLYFAKK